MHGSNEAGQVFRKVWLGGISECYRKQEYFDEYCREEVESKVGTYPSCRLLVLRA